MELNRDLRQARLSLESTQTELQTLQQRYEKELADLKAENMQNQKKLEHMLEELKEASTENATLRKKLATESPAKTYEKVSIGLY